MNEAATGGFVRLCKGKELIPVSPEKRRLLRREFRINERASSVDIAP